MTQLKGYKINSVYFENKVHGTSKLSLQNQVKYNVNYTGNDNDCIGVLNFRVFDTDMQPFEIKIEAVAEFTYDASDEKEDIHVDSFAQFFPYIRQAVSSITGISGMPPLIIPIMRLERSNVDVRSKENNSDEGILN